MKLNKILVFYLFNIIFVLSASSQQKGYYRFPSINGEEIVFTAEGDLWKYNLVTNISQRLTTHHGMESQASISPDGTQIAFIGEYEGSSEVYLIPAGGGIPRRLTYEESNPRISGWTRDGKILYSTFYYSTLPNAQLLELEPRTASSTIIPLSQADQGTYTDKGDLFFTRLWKQSSHTKRYKGGTVQSIWKFDGKNEAIHITDDYEGTCKDPMYYKDRIYFLSDKDGTMNIWSMSISGEDLQQHTFFSGWDLFNAEMDNGKIVCQKGADIFLFTVETGKEEIIDIKLCSDFDQKRKQWIIDPISKVSSINISDDGQDVVITARGRVFNIPVNGERWAEISKKNGVRYKNASFCGGKDNLFMLSDESGEYEIWRASNDGLLAPEQLTFGSTNIITYFSVSPDGRFIVYSEKDNNLKLFDIQTKKSKLIDDNDYGDFNPPFSWSYDSKWFAYVSNTDNQNMVIMIYNVDQGKNYTISTNRLDSYNPKFSPDGRWLYFLSDRTFNNYLNSPWGPRQPEPYFDKTTKIYALGLTGDARFPFLANNELMDQLSNKYNHPSVAINFENIDARLYEVPVQEENIRDIEVTDSFIIYLQKPPKSEEGTLKVLNISNKLDNRPSILANGILSFSVSHDGNKLLLRSPRDIFILNTDAEKLDTVIHKLKIKNWSFNSDPVEDWKQMFRDAWRMERDYFYDPNMHGLDWDEVYKKYSSLLPRITDRFELDDLIGQMNSELSALHMTVKDGDKRTSPDKITLGHLGAVFHKDSKTGSFIIDHIYRSDPDFPDIISPLAKPYLDVNEGDAIVSVNGTDVSGLSSLNELLANKVGMQVRIKLKKANGKVYEVIVNPIDEKAFIDLRHSEWEYTRLLDVDRRTNGRIGYVRLRSMSASNYDDWIKGFYPNYHKEAIIIDVRHNGGGSTDSWVLEKLLRKAWFYWAPRKGEPFWNMQYAFRGHIVVLIDEKTGSDAEAFAEGIKRLKLGTLIGKRTWGGEIWLNGNTRLVDNGIASAPQIGVFSPEGEWIIEGRGVEPDIEVDNLPFSSFSGKDAQLDAAIEYLTDKMKKEPIVVPNIPERPDKSFSYLP